MARVKNKHGLTPQQEMFCQYVVDAYGTETRGILVNAYRKAYKCKNGSKISTHYDSASKLMKNPEITHRIEQLQEELTKAKTISRDQLVTRNAHILDGDPLIMQKIDAETGQLVFKRLNEIPKFWRKLVVPIFYRGRMAYVLDKKTAEQNLIKICGYESANEVKLNMTGNLGSELTLLDEHDIFED